MNKSVEQRHAIQKSARPMDQMEYQGIIWVIKADADKRITELEKKVERQREALVELMLEQPETEVCEWWADDDPDMWGDSGLWESTCGVAYQFTSGGPEENNHKFCHKCGKPIHISEGGADE